MGIKGKLRILFVVYGILRPYAGSTGAILGLMRSLVSQGMDVLLFSTQDEKQDVSDVFMPNDDVWLFPIRAPRNIYYSPAFFEALKKTIPNVDLVHIHNIWSYSEINAVKLASETGIPSIVTPHGLLNPWAMKHHYWRKKFHQVIWSKRILKKATLFHALTHEEEKSIRAAGFLNPVKIISNGIDVSVNGPASNQKNFKNRFSIPENFRVIMFLGRLHPSKGLEILIRAFKRISIHLKDVILVIAGPDDVGYQKKLIGLLGDHEAMDRTRFTGPLRGIEKYLALKESDIFILPSYSEGFPIAVLEAMSSGVPVMVSSQCNIPEAESGGAGVTIGVDDEVVAQKAIELLEKPDIRKEMGERGRRLVAERYSWEHISTEYLKMYRSLCGTHE